MYGVWSATGTATRSKTEWLLSPANQEHTVKWKWDLSPLRPRAFTGGHFNWGVFLKHCNGKVKTNFYLILLFQWGITKRSEAWRWQITWFLPIFCLSLFVFSHFHSAVSSTGFTSWKKSSFLGQWNTNKVQRTLALLSSPAPSCCSSTTSRWLQLIDPERRAQSTNPQTGWWCPTIRLQFWGQSATNMTNWQESKTKPKTAFLSNRNHFFL